MNASDRLVSYEDLEDVQRKELSQKGNSKIFYEENYPSFDMSVKVNSIVNNNYYVVSKRMTIDNKVTNVEYTLTKDYPFKNEDVGLGIEYERYLIPYEFVMRDIYLENHLLFSTRNLNTDPKYFSEELGCTQEFLEDIFINGLGTFLYSQMKFDYDNEDSRKILMRLAKLESKFTMILTGKFPDNYSAGTQRFGGYIGNDPELAGEFSQPYRYTDYRGRVKSISEFAIGYSDDSGEVSKKKLVVKKEWNNR